MKFLHHNATTKTQWQIYKQLELIPESVQPPRINTLLTFGFGPLWQWLLIALTDELIDEQQVEYLERCWLLNDWNENRSPVSTLQRLWTLMD